MAKKQTRRSISVSRTTYERLKAFCESNNISMSQFVETRVGDFLGQGEGTTTVEVTPRPMTPRPVTPGPMPAKPAAPINKPETRPAVPSPAPTTASAQQVPMTSAAARFAVDPPPPVIKPKQEQPAPKPAEKKADQIFTF
jgi:hypothetical protein